MASAVAHPFLKGLDAFDLSPDQRKGLAELRNQAPRAMAQELVRRKWLTPFQANRLYSGAGDELVLGRYVILDKLGEGGMGQVLLARHREAGTLAALKVLRQDCLDNAKMVQRFRRESEIFKSLDHPHIVRSFEAEQVDGRHYIAMEYVRGVDLARKVKREGPLSVRAALDYVRQTALGLQHAMECGLIHRDIKPANLLVADMAHASDADKASFPHGKLKILDLGLARWVDANAAQLTAAGAVMGTPDFLSPDQAANARECDIRADLYSLGCSLYFMLAGRVPFPKGTVPEKLIQHHSAEPPPVALVRAERIQAIEAKTGVRAAPETLFVAPEVDAIVRRLMAKKPEDRFQTPAELVAHIEALVRHWDAPPPPPPTYTYPVLPTPYAFSPAPSPAPLVWDTLAAEGTAIVGDVRMPANRSPWRIALVGIAAIAVMTLAAVSLQRHRTLEAASPPVVAK